MVLAVSVTVNCTVTPSACRLTLPFSTMPPMRKLRPCGALLATTSLGVKKNTRFSWNALSTSAVTAPRATTPITMAAIRLCLGFTRPFHDKDNLEGEACECHAVRTPYVPRIAAHRQEFAHPPRSVMMQRTRSRVTAMAYIQNASAMRIIPANMVAAMVGALLSETDEPWCRVFHHFTEK